MHTGECMQVSDRKQGINKCWPNGKYLSQCGYSTEATVTMND